MKEKEENTAAIAQGLQSALPYPVVVSVLRGVQAEAAADALAALAALIQRTVIHPESAEWHYDRLAGVVRTFLAHHGYRLPIQPSGFRPASGSGPMPAVMQFPVGSSQESYKTPATADCLNCGTPIYWHAPEISWKHAEEGYEDHDAIPAATEMSSDQG